MRGSIIGWMYGSGRKIKVYPGAILENSDIHFGKEVSIYPNVHVFGSGKLVLGDNVIVGDGTIICVADSIEIGANTMIAAQCYITDCSHGTRAGALMRLQPMRIKPVIIGNDVWIGCGSKILMGAEIGNGTVIGAGATITKKINTMKFLVPDRTERVLTDRI